MNRFWLTGTFAVLVAWSVATLSASSPGVTLIGIGRVDGARLDKSGLAGRPICQREDHLACIDQATFGGWGSGVTYTGLGNIFLAVPDRGPYDGRTDVPYRDRVHVLDIRVDQRAAFPNITTTLVDTRLLEDEWSRPLVGDAYAFDTAHPFNTRRFDPEAITVGAFGTFFAADEYGPYVREFTPSGHLLRRIPLPAKFLLDPVNGHPSGDLDGPGGTSLEVYPAFNVTGRQANRGMEGLTITPNGRTLVGIMQNALLQDFGVDPATVGRVGFNNRIVTIDLLTGRRREYVYPMDAVNQGRGVNEILAINDHELLVLERDNRTNVPTPPNAAASPNLKRLYRIDLAKPGLTDVSALPLPQAAVPQTNVPPAIVPVTKTLFLDLLDPSYVVDGTTSPVTTIKDVIAEKIEGLAWGPRLKDGRLVLYVFSDNDLYPALPTQIYAFAIDAKAAGIRYQAQQVLLPVVWPWELPRHLR